MPTATTIDSRLLWALALTLAVTGGVLLRRPSAAIGPQVIVQAKPTAGVVVPKEDVLLAAVGDPFSPPPSRVSGKASPTPGSAGVIAAPAIAKQAPALLAAVPSPAVIAVPTPSPAPAAPVYAGMVRAPDGALAIYLRDGASTALAAPGVVLPSGFTVEAVAADRVRLRHPAIAEPVEVAVPRENRAHATP